MVTFGGLTAFAIWITTGAELPGVIPVGIVR